MRAYILITAKPGTSEEIVAAVKRTRSLKGVKIADSVYGRFDAVVVVDVKSLDELTRLTYKIIERLPNVTHTETLISLMAKG
ncbi:MAG: AsnC family transcriptional regulator [Candidatus Hecatellales archaeon B24]|nr:MAG: AsnC family transcriptional regulator [Candidatus Hecatellales archaeon B24]